jgi:metallo-beta-lactamase family protein
MECTYGNYNHRPLSLAVHQLEHIIMEAFHSKSKIIVPAFALGRTQELIYTLHQLTDQKRIPRIPIYIDSPLAINIGQVFMNHTEDFGPEAWHDFGKANEVPFMFRNLTYIHSVEESKQLNSLPGPFMVISASGMCEGGRVLHHLKNNIEDRNAIILLTGYQAQNTLGRKLHHGISPVNIFGRPYRVRAKIMTLNEFSAHADQQALLQYIKHIPAPKKLFLVHGEPEQAEALEQSAQTILKKYSTKIITPSVGESFDA